MAGSELASVLVNVEAGSYMTFAGPVILFSIVASILYLQFSRPHARVPPRRVLAPSRAGGPGQAGNASGAAPDEPGSAEDPEPAGAVSAATTTTGSVSGEPAEAGGADDGTASTETTEAGE
jgi:hypothetical protein